MAQVVAYLPSKCESPEFKSQYHQKKRKAREGEGPSENKEMKIVIPVLLSFQFN
jgi:hypothetical protein